MVSDASKKKAEQKKAATTAKREGKAAAAATLSKAAMEASNGVEKVSDGIRSLYISDRTCTGVLFSHPQTRDIHAEGGISDPLDEEIQLSPHSRFTKRCHVGWFRAKGKQHVFVAYTCKNILRQDIAFFDNETSSGQVIERMAGDTILIQDAIGEKVGKCIQLVSTFFGGFIVAFSRGWLLTLVMLSSIPPVVIAGGAMSLMVSKLPSRGQKAYAEARTVVEQTVGFNRTVVSFTGEKHAIENYNKLVKSAYQSAVFEGTVSGHGVGCVLFIIFSSYALAI